MKLGEEQEGIGDRYGCVYFLVWGSLFCFLCPGGFLVVIIPAMVGGRLQASQVRSSRFWQGVELESRRVKSGSADIRVSEAGTRT